MKIIIDIPEKDIPKHQEVIDIRLHFIDGHIVDADGYGFMELPKGHGRLIDADDINIIELEDSLHFMQHIKGDDVDVYIDAPTIIEADKEESE